MGGLVTGEDQEALTGGGGGDVDAGEQGLLLGGRVERKVEVLPQPARQLVRVQLPLHVPGLERPNLPEPHQHHLALRQLH